MCVFPSTLLPPSTAYARITSRAAFQTKKVRRIRCATGRLIHVCAAAINRSSICKALACSHRGRIMTSVAVDLHQWQLISQFTVGFTCSYCCLCVRPRGWLHCCGCQEKVCFDQSCGRNKLSQSRPRGRKRWSHDFSGREGAMRKRDKACILRPIGLGSSVRPLVHEQINCV